MAVLVDIEQVLAHLEQTVQQNLHYLYHYPLIILLQLAEEEHLGAAHQIIILQKIPVQIQFLSVLPHLVVVAEVQTVIWDRMVVRAEVVGEDILPWEVRELQDKATMAEEAGAIAVLVTQAEVAAVPEALGLPEVLIQLPEAMEVLVYNLLLPVYRYIMQAVVAPGVIQQATLLV